MKYRAVAVLLAALALALTVVCLLTYLGVLGASSLPVRLVPPALNSRTDVEPNLLWHVLYSTGRGVVAFVVGLGIFLLTVPLHRYSGWRILVGVVGVSHAIPPLVWVPLMLLAFGVNEQSLLVASIIFVVQGLLVSAPEISLQTRRRLAFYRLIGVAPVRRFMSVELPDLVNEMSRAITMLWLVLVGVVIATEYVGSVSGVGRALSILVSYADTGSVLAVSLLTGLGTMCIAAGIDAFAARTRGVGGGAIA